MNSVKILHKHSDNKNTACKKAESMLDSLAKDYGLTIENNEDGVITFSGSGVTGTVTINHNEINISATLGFLMMPMKPIITNEIKKKLAERFV